jgi:hypothetical protein
LHTCRAAFIKGFDYHPNASGNTPASLKSATRHAFSSQRILLLCNPLPRFLEATNARRRLFRYQLGKVPKTMDKAYRSITVKLPILGFNLLLQLVGQFNFCRKASIILATIPVGEIGFNLSLPAGRLCAVNSPYFSNNQNRGAGMHRIRALRWDVPDYHRIYDGGDHLAGFISFTADLDIDSEYRLQALRPSH